MLLPFPPTRIPLVLLHLEFRMTLLKAPGFASCPLKCSTLTSSLQNIISYKCKSLG